MDKVLIDTNIFIYAIDRSSVYHQKANQILSDEMIELFTTSKNISEFFAVCSKLKVDDKQSLRFYEDIKNNIEILFPNAESLKHFEKLVKKYHPIGNQVYDIEIISIMQLFEIKVIATFNAKDFKNVSEIKILD